MNDVVDATSGWIDAAQSVQADTVALRRAIHAEPELGLADPEDAGQGPRRARRLCRSNGATGTSTTGAVAVLRGAQAGPHGAAARRHGRAADARGHRAAVRVDRPRARCTPAATTRTPRCSRRRARGCSARGADARRRPCASCSSRARKASTARASCSRTACSTRCPTPPSRCTSCPTRQHGVLASRGRAAARLRRQARDRRRAAAAAMPRCRTTRVDPVPVACEIVTAIQALVTRRFDVVRSDGGDDHQDRRRHRPQHHPRARRAPWHDPHAVARHRARRCTRGLRASPRHRAAHECNAEVVIDAASR